MFVKKCVHSIADAWLIFVDKGKEKSVCKENLTTSQITSIYQTVLSVASILSKKCIGMGFMFIFRNLKMDAKIISK